MLLLSVKTPRCDTFPQAAWRTVNPATRYQDSVKPQPGNHEVKYTELKLIYVYKAGRSHPLEAQVSLCSAGGCESQKLKKTANTNEQMGN